MGIFKAARGSIGGTLADQWLEIYSCGAFPQGILAQRGVKKSSARSANTKGEENVISDGSTIIVHSGQCALAIDRGQVTGCYDKPGENIYHSDRTGSIFHKGGLKSIAKQSFERFGYGGIAPVYQVIMYLDMKEHFANPFSLKAPINLTDRNTGMSIDATIMLSGLFSFRIVEPTTFYKRICGNTTGSVMISKILPQLTAELNNLLTIAISEQCNEGMNAYELSMKADEMIASAQMKANEKWQALRGFAITSIGVDSISLTKQDKDLLQSVQYAKALTNPQLAAATLVAAQAQAMQDAAQNNK